MAKNHTTVAEIHENDQHNSSNRATYCPEDNKIRLYIGGDGRVERETYNYLRANKWTATPKQSCSFVATWHPSTEDTAYALIEEGDEIGDEDYSPEERAADRAERFAGYRDKRAGEAHGHADRYEDGPQAFGAQNAHRAERQAARHERHRERALTQWSKAEYWQERTAGVIRNALHRSDASTRRGRILTIEADIRKIEASYTPKKNASTYTDEKDGETYVYCSPGGRGGEWVKVSSLEYRKAAYARAITHLQRRLIYENAMLENEGGQASEVEMIPGGFIGKRQIWKINRSPATGRVVSVAFSATGGPRNIERLGADVYRAPTLEELAAFSEQQAAKKAERKATAPPLINPTPEDAQRLQDYWNSLAKGKQPRKVCEVTQKQYSALSGGPDSIYRTRTHTVEGVTFKIRARHPGFYDYGASESVICITDKLQKPLPIDWSAIAPQEEPAETPTPEPVAEEITTTEETPEPIEAAAQELVTAPAGCLF